VVIQGVAGGSGTAGKEEGRPALGADAVSASALPGSGGRLLDYGRAGRVERDFSFIRDGVIRHVSYPDRARRMGWEGRVVLSFMVLEGGSVQDVKVTESSGHRVLDENARDAVMKARFSRKVPYRLTVVLPVEYRLE
jgi:protein TonB